MLEFLPPINESNKFNNLLMFEKKPIAKINLRGNSSNKDFSDKVIKILGITPLVEVGRIVFNKEISVLTTGPNEWIIISNNTVKEDNNDYQLENILYENISKNNLGAVTNITDQFTVFSLSGSNIFEVLSKSLFSSLANSRILSSISWEFLTYSFNSFVICSSFIRIFEE